MLPASSELIEQAIAIMGTDGMAEEEVEQKIAALSKDPMLARRLIDWLPEAFGIVLVSHMGGVNLPTTFSAKTSRGQWLEFELNAEPIFQNAARVAMEMYHSGPRNIFSNIALRSSMLSAVNQALNQGGSLEGATLSGPALIGIPAEIYAPPPRSLWARLFR
jgi:hypothetical protein